MAKKKPRVKRESEMTEKELRNTLDKEHAAVERRWAKERRERQKRKSK